MQKKLYIVFFLLLISLVFTGCQNNITQEQPELPSHAKTENSRENVKTNDSKTLRICLDVDHNRSGAVNDTNAALLEFKNTLEQSGGLTNVEFEYLPASGSERESMINRLRIELMSGEGPDVFIIKRHTIADENISDPLFSMPEKMMANDMFLPLDEYIENNTQFTDWDKLTQTVLAAGRDEEGQQIIPLAYTMPILYYQRFEENEIVPKDMTFEEILAKEDLSDFAKLLIRTKYIDEDGIINYTGGSELLHIFGELADYESEELLFTQEELQRELDRLFDISDDLISHPESREFVYDRSSLDSYLMMNVSSLPGYKADMDFDLISVCSEDGGYTALITAYAAVNRNTNCPDEAFTVVDLLLRTNVQQNYMLYTDSLHYGGFPIHEELMSPTYPAGLYERSFNENVFSEINEIRENITSARFSGDLDTSLHMLIFQYTTALESGEPTEEVVAEAYRQMQRLLRE